jgi:hypothetical protein
MRPLYWQIVTPHCRYWARKTLFLRYRNTAPSYPEKSRVTCSVSNLHPDDVNNCNLFIQIVKKIIPNLSNALILTIKAPRQAAKIVCILHDHAR